METPKPDPVENMPVTWVEEKDLSDQYLHRTLHRLVRTYGRGPGMTILDTEELPEGGSVVTLLYGGEPIRKAWNDEDGIQPPDWEGEVLQVNWCYLRPA